MRLNRIIRIILLGVVVAVVVALAGLGRTMWADVSLVRGAEADSIEQVRRAIRAGANVNTRMPVTREPVLVWAIRSGQVEIAHEIIGNNPHVQYDSRSDESPLVWAAGKNNLRLVSELLRRGADPNVQTQSAQLSPLMIAAYWSDLDVIEALLDAGARTDSRDYRHHTVAQFAARRRDGKNAQVLRLLATYEKRGADASGEARAEDALRLMR